MKLAKPKCLQCSCRAIGTVDLIPGTALFDAVPTLRRSVGWAGETKVCWDGQETITNENGESKVTCDNGHEWFTRVTHTEE